jgi:SnoaL-like polyketide cyclase
MKMVRLCAMAIGWVGASLAFVTPAAVAGQDHWPPTSVDKPEPVIPGIPPVLAKNLGTFDDLDFHVYTGQHWENLHRSHAKDIIVYYPDGHTTTGIPDHIKELNFMWTFAPDNRITEHHVRFGTGDGEWTAVMGYLDGTFTKPMALPGGKVIQPTGKAYHLAMATLGHWNKEGTMDKEYLFWDNASLMTQIGAGN